MLWDFLACAELPFKVYYAGVGENRHVEEEMKQSEKKQLGYEQAVYRLCAGCLQAETGCFGCLQALVGCLHAMCRLLTGYVQAVYRLRKAVYRLYAGCLQAVRRLLQAGASCLQAEAGCVYAVYRLL